MSFICFTLILFSEHKWSRETQMKVTLIFYITSQFNLLFISKSIIFPTQTFNHPCLPERNRKGTHGD